MTYNPAEALNQAEQSQTLLRKVLESRPDSDSDLRALAEDQGVLTLALIDLGRVAEAVAAAGQLPATRPADWAAYLHAAGLLIRCAQAAPNSPEGRQQAEGSLARAVSILREAVRAKLIPSRPPPRPPGLPSPSRSGRLQSTAPSLCPEPTTRVDPTFLSGTIQGIVTRLTISPDGVELPPSPFNDGGFPRASGSGGSRKGMNR